MKRMYRIAAVGIVLGLGTAGTVVGSIYINESFTSPLASTGQTGIPADWELDWHQTPSNSDGDFAGAPVLRPVAWPSITRRPKGSIPFRISRRK